MTKEELIKEGWEEVDGFMFKQYKKNINDFDYVLTYFPDIPEEYRTNNRFDWGLHIDDPKFQTVCSCEVNSLDDIKLLSEIYQSTTHA